MQATAVRLGFCAGVAVTAAAVADPLLEWASNAGCFGPGSFTDGSTLDVLPALAAGTFVLAAVVAARIVRARRGRGRAAQDVLLRALAASLEGRLARVIPAIYALQLAALYGMESLEQRLVAGHVLGGTVWLGAPPLVALLGHALCAIILTPLAARAVRACAASGLLAIRRGEAAPCSVRAIEPIGCRNSGPKPQARRRPDLAERRGRAPPSMLALT